MSKNFHFLQNEEDVKISLKHRTLSISLDSDCVFFIHYKKYNSIILDYRLRAENSGAAKIFDDLINFTEENYVLNGKRVYVARNAN